MKDLNINMEEIKAWIGRALLAIITYFLMQINTKYTDVVDTLDELVIKVEIIINEQEEIWSEIDDLKEETEKLEKKDQEFQKGIIDFYKNKQKENHSSTN